VWFVVCFTVERYLVIRFPLKRQQICRPNRAKVVVVGLTGLALVLYNFAIWTSEVATLDPLDPLEKPICQVRLAKLTLSTIRSGFAVTTKTFHCRRNCAAKVQI
jgi:hypothetical protein